MSRTIFQGRLSHRVRSLYTATRIATGVGIRHLLGRRLLPAWPPLFEYGTLFWRAQFHHALRLQHDMPACRAYFDSLYSVFDDYADVTVRPASADEPAGCWYLPRTRHSDVTVLHFHGGGYAFHAAVSHHFARMLAHYLGAPVFAADYRLTPEHAHPAQLEDGLAAYRHLLARGIAPQRIVLCGDSAGGHLALMTLAQLAGAGLPQPLLTIGISPWTDIGRRGASQFGNDRYDMVQGYMTLLFARWLKGDQQLDDAALSPIAQNYRGCSPIYLQAGAREILVDMIRDFATSVAAQGVAARLDVWPEMNHEFHSYGEYLPQSRDALLRLRQAIGWASGQASLPAADGCTELDRWSCAGL